MSLLVHRAFVAMCRFSSDFAPLGSVLKTRMACWLMAPTVRWERRVHCFTRKLLAHGAARPQHSRRPRRSILYEFKGSESARYRVPCTLHSMGRTGHVLVKQGAVRLAFTALTLRQTRQVSAQRLKSVFFKRGRLSSRAVDADGDLVAAERDSGGGGPLDLQEVGVGIRVKARVRDRV